MRKINMANLRSRFLKRYEEPRNSPALSFVILRFMWRAELRRPVLRLSPSLGLLEGTTRGTIGATGGIEGGTTELSCTRGATPPSTLTMVTPAEVWFTTVLLAEESKLHSIKKIWKSEIPRFTRENYFQFNSRENENN